MPRNTVPLCVTLLPTDRERLQAFSDATGRPQSWIVRDALTAYLTAVEKDAKAIVKLQAKLKAPAVLPLNKKPTRAGRPGKETK